MARYDDEYENTPMNRQKDLVLATNEFVYVQSRTNGQIRVYSGPIMLTISAQEALVIFNPKTKRFEETSDFEKARQLFVSAPEGWYVVLKNPAPDGLHPETAKAVNGPELEIGHKVNIPGPCNFSLFPGQMSKVVRGHRLRSNQYLLARVYDAAAARKGMTEATVIDSEGKEIAAQTEQYFAGQLLVIKGTEVSFYMPPTGIEVIAIDNKDNLYVRDAVTLERLEYAILKDEDGEKRYVHGPAVVFPEPTETFVETPKGGNIFRALELSPISGIYVKVIAEYTDDKGILHPVGEELFITGNDQMIYYPRPEHAMIQYDGKYMHHAIAIPEGEGRYILNRLTGEVKTIVGPKMYLPDPRTEVVVKRKLTEKECNLLYPNNQEVFEYNKSLSERKIEKNANSGKITNSVLDNIYATADQSATLAIFEANANISRGVSYTKPRTITLDTKFDGVVSVDVWTGYAINVVSKTGKREIVIGPVTRLLDYDETLEAMELSTGKPKTTDNLLTTAFLRVENNKISDIINIVTKDFVNVQVKISYCVNFLADYKDKWFSVENYVKYLCDHQRSLLKREAKQYNIEEFYNNATDIIRTTLLDEREDNIDGGRLFTENGMLVYDVEVLSVKVESHIARMLEDHQTEMIAKTLDLTDAAKKMDTLIKLSEYQKQEAELIHNIELYKLQLEEQRKEQKFALEAALNEKQRAEDRNIRQAESDLQEIINTIQHEKIERVKAEQELQISHKQALAEIEKSKQQNYAETVDKIITSITPDLVAALSTKANADLLTTATQNMSPLAIAKGESVAETVNTLLRGTSLEGIIEKMNTPQE